MNIKFANFINLILTIIPKTNGVKTNKISWTNEESASILNSLDLVVTIVSQNKIVTGDTIVAKDVKNTDNGTFPPFMCDSNPETCPPGTIKTITADTVNKELLNIFS